MSNDPESFKGYGRNTIGELWIHCVSASTSILCRRLLSEHKFADGNKPVMTLVCASCIDPNNGRAA